MRQMLALWLPLAASLLMMVLEPSIINIGLGRTLDPESALAAYGIAFSLALLVEAPIIMLLDASVARSSDPEAFTVFRRFTVILGLVVTAVGLVISLTPLYDLIVQGLMNIPADLSAKARPTLRILSFWPLPIAWRRAHQGVLIRTGRTAIITIATGIRLLSLAGGLFAGLLLMPGMGGIVAGIAMVFSVVVEAGIITAATRPILRLERFGNQATSEAGASLTMMGLWRFYRPLVSTTILRQAMRPLLNAGIALAAMPRASLAAWPVAWGVAILVTGPAWSLQQLTTALATDPIAYRRVRTFAICLSIGFSLILALVAFTPLYGFVMGEIYNLSTSLQEVARPSLQLMVLLPLVMGVQAFLRGTLIRGGYTSVVNSAMMLNVATVVAALAVGVTVWPVSGVLIAAVATLAGGLAELAWLRHRSFY
jgi:hypothetical protein